MAVEKRSYHHGNLRADLIDAAWNQLRSCSPEELSLREIAKAVGVSPNAPYRHFEDKDALLASIAERGFRELTATFDKSSARSPQARLAVFAEAYLAYAQKNPSVYRVMFGKHLHDFAPYPGLEEASTRAFAQLVALVKEVVGLPSEDDQRVIRGAMIAWSMVHGLAMLAMDCPIMLSVPERVPSPDLLAAVLSEARLAIRVKK